MATEEDEKGTTPAEPDETETTGGPPSCGPGCGCGEPAGKGNTKIKIAVCLVVTFAIFGILLFKTTKTRQNSSAIEPRAFSNPFAAKGNRVVLNSSGQQGGSGAALSAIAELNTVAANVDTVFVVIPAKDKAPLAKKEGDAVASVEGTLNAKGLSTGVYTLKADSPDYPDIAAKVKTPGIAVLTKGRGIGFASGGVSETNLMQAYVASTRGGGCGPGGCPPNGGKSNVPCN